MGGKAWGAALISLAAVGCAYSSFIAAAPIFMDSHAVSQDDAVLRDLFDRWERVWQEGAYDLVPDCLTDTYIRHDVAGDRTVTRDAFAADIAKVREEHPSLRVVVYEHKFDGNRAWFRFAYKWVDRTTGAPRSQAGMQSYRIEDGKLAETWLTMMPPGSKWSDAVAQEHWTSLPASP
jgi:predicted SnoaL-like aldol condensation-catalyzing enzyme